MGENPVENVGDGLGGCSVLKSFKLCFCAYEQVFPTCAFIITGVQRTPDRVPRSDGSTNPGALGAPWIRIKTRFPTSSA